MPKKSEEKNGNKSFILKTATDLFAEKGKDAVGIREIAKLSNVSLNTVTYYFGTKDNLYKECSLHAFKNGINYEEIFAAANSINFSDKQDVADAVAGIILALFSEASKGTFLNQARLIMQNTLSTNKDYVYISLEAFEMFEKPFLSFLDKAGVEYTFESKAMILNFVWSQCIFYLAAPTYISTDLNMETVPQEVYNGVAFWVASHVCMDLELPQPAFN